MGSCYKKARTLRLYHNVSYHGNIRGVVGCRFQTTMPVQDNLLTRGADFVESPSRILAMSVIYSMDDGYPSTPPWYHLMYIHVDSTIVHEVHNT